MSLLFFLIWCISLIAFIVFWWKKYKARKAAGDAFSTDEKYLSISKTKKIIGYTCAASFVLFFVFLEPSKETSTTPPQTSTPVTEEKPPVTETKTPSAEENLIGSWYSVEKDSSGVVTSITILDIANEKSATLKTFTLTAGKFAENEPVKIFWQIGTVQANIKRSGKNLKFTAVNDIEILKNCKFDGKKISADNLTFTKENFDVENLKTDSLNQYAKNIGGAEVIADMTQAEYKDYINQKIFGIQ